MPPLEETILGHLLIQPEFLKILVLDKNFFRSERQKLVFKEIENGNTDVGLITKKIGEKDSFSYVSSLMDGIPKTKGVNLNRLINEVKRERKKRELLQSIEKQARIAKRTGDFDLTEIRKKFEELDKINIENPLKIETLQDFRQREIPRREIIMQYHAEKEAVSILAGKLKRGKSLYAMQMAFCIAAGKDFLGFSVPKPRKTLFINQEISESSTKERTDLMLASCEFPLLEENFLIINTVGNLIKITNPSHRAQLFRDIDQYEPDLIICDPFSSFHNKKENDEKEMSEVMDYFFEISKKFRVGIFLIHHYGKPSLAQRTGGHELRGHSILGDRPDIIILFNALPEKYKNSPLPHTIENYAEIEFILRSDAKPDNIILKRDPETLWYQVYDLYGQLGRKIRPERVIDIIREHGGKILRTELMEELLEYASKRVALKALQEAKEKYHIESESLPGRGNPVQLILKEKEVF